MRVFLLFILMLSFHNGQTQTAKEILDRSIDFHNPEDSWTKALLQIEVDEPRIMNPTRHSVLAMDNASGAFRLERQRGQSVSTHIIDSSGQAITYFDGRIVQDTDSIATFRLNPERNYGYRYFYQMMVGLPMSLSDSSVDSLGSVQSTSFNGQEAFRIEVFLVEPLFSRVWHLFVHKSSYQVLGLEIAAEEMPGGGERITFDQIVEVDKMIIPRIRHWHQLNDNKYAGSDIILY